MHNTTICIYRVSHEDMNIVRSDYINNALILVRHSVQGYT
jgi:hypothetical protein